ATNGQVWVIYPDNHSERAMLNFTLAPGATIKCIEVPADPSCEIMTASWLVSLSDVTPHAINIVTNIPEAEGFSFACSGTTFDTNHILFICAAQAQNGPFAAFPATCTEQEVTIVHPAIEVAEQCVTNCPPRNSAAYGEQINFSGTV